MYYLCNEQTGTHKVSLKMSIIGYYTGDRKGQWACDLDQPYRLIFEPHEKPIPKNAEGRYLWIEIEIKGVEIIEIVDYHGK